MLVPTRYSAEEMSGFVASGLWQETTTAGACDQYALRFPGKVALADAVVRYTWRELRDASDGVAAGLVNLGFARGDRVLLQLPSGALEVLLRIALKKAGLIGISAPMQWREQEIAATLAQTRPAAAVLPCRFKGDDLGGIVAGLQGSCPTLRHLIALDKPPPGWIPFADLQAYRATPTECADLRERQIRWHEVSLINCSSGSTGLPKLCEWPEAAQVLEGRGLAERLGLTPADNLALLAPLSGGPGTTAACCIGSVPCQYTLANSYEPLDLLEVIQRERVTVISTVPVVVARLAQAPEVEQFDVSSLRVVRAGAAALDGEIARLVEERLGCRVVPSAGTMEVPCFAQHRASDPAHIRLNGSVGSALPGCRFRIINDRGVELPPGESGELQLWSIYGSSGYAGDPAGTAAAWQSLGAEGWFTTGDVAVLDAAGRVTLIGRKKEMINRGGLKVFPLEVERFMAGHPDVAEVAITGVPHSEYGQVPWAFVIPRAGRRVDPVELQGYLRQQGLATYKIPVAILLLSDFPRIGGSIKVDKRQLVATHGPAPAAPSLRFGSERPDTAQLGSQP